METLEKYAELGNLTTIGSWREQIFKLANELGYERSLLAILPGHDTPPDVDLAFLHSNYSSEWLKKYDKDKLGHVDPVVFHCVTKSTPLIWTPDIFSVRRQKELYEEACSHGIRSGVTFPIHGTCGELGILSFATDTKPDQRHRQEIVRNIPELSCLRDFIFETSHRFIKPTSSSTKDIELTHRELECLKWTATGKSSWDISQILHCSESAVNFHFSNIRRKFGTSSRRQAVVKAIALGIINPM